MEFYGALNTGCLEGIPQEENIYRAVILRDSFIELIVKGLFLETVSGNFKPLSLKT